MGDETNTNKPRIFVDEDWKSQVEAEKEAARRKDQPTTAPPNGDGAGESVPPPSLLLLANSLYLQAMISLGVLPNPISKKSEVQLPHAKYSIDMLEMLQEKTEGNRTAEETEDMEAMLHQLRLAYVAAGEKGKGLGIRD